MQWTSRGAVLVLVILMAAPAAARADGGPVPPSQGTAIHVPGDTSGYGAFAAGRATIVKRLGVNDVPTGAQLRVAGHYGIPGVTFNGATTGLSADGRTLVLAQIVQRGVPRVTRLLVINAPRLTIRSRLALPGWSVVDAISPDGRWLYLIHYRAANLSTYEVLGYDLRHRRMLPRPIVDPDDRGEAMTGFPVTRVMSAGSRWAYTLYMRPSGEPFVHALDTVAHRAVCVDLPSLTGLDFSNGELSLGSGGALLRVDLGHTAAAVINTRTFALVTHTGAAGPSSSASEAAPRPVPHPSASRAPQGVSWELVAGLLAALVAVGAGIALTRRARPVPRAPSPR
jgi:hypothetical protein